MRLKSIKSTLSLFKMVKLITRLFFRLNLSVINYFSSTLAMKNLPQTT